MAALAWAIRLFALASLLTFVYWLFVVIGWFLLLSILLGGVAYGLLRLDVARNPVYRGAPPSAVDDDEMEEEIVPRATALGIPLGFMRREVRPRPRGGRPPS